MGGKRRKGPYFCIAFFHFLKLDSMEPKVLPPLYMRLFCIIPLLPFVLIGLVSQAHAADHNFQLQVSGTVTSQSDHRPLTGVTVQVKGTDIGTTTNADGHYQLSVPDANDTLVFTYIGYRDQEVAVNGQTTIDVQLKASAQSLNELIVTGYMTQKKANLTGAISVVPAEELERNHGATNIMTALQGKVPGLSVSTNGDPTQGHLGIQIRGQTSVVGAPPLIVIDGVPSHINLRDLNAGNIASIQVLKDAASASIYGAQGAGGVILIETKKGKPGKATIRYQGSVGFSGYLNMIDLMNTQQYGRALWQASVNSGLDPNDVTQIYTYDWHKNDEGIPILDKVTPIQWLNDAHTMPSANTDWLDAITHWGLQNNHQITVSGGSEKATSLLSLNFFQNQGPIKFTAYKRYTIRLNTSYKVIDDHFTIGENLEASRLNLTTQNDQGVMHSAMVEPSIIPVHTTDGGWGGTAVGLGMDDYWNPVRELTLNKDNRNKYNKLFGDVYANVFF
jgi:TonB-linked SusC/RagA family outer membrane protein